MNWTKQIGDIPQEVHLHWPEADRFQLIRTIEAFPYGKKLLKEERKLVSEHAKAAGEPLPSLAGVSPPPTLMVMVS